MKNLCTAARLCAFGCAALIGLWNTSQAIAADDTEPAITLKTAAFEYADVNNLFTINMDADELIYVVVDCGFGPVEYEVEPSEDGTWIPCTVDNKGTVRMWTDKPEVINYFYCQGGQITEIDLSKLTTLQVLDLSNNSLKKIDLSNNKQLQYLDLGTNPFDEQPLYIGELPLLQALEMENVGNVSPDFTIRNFPELVSFAAFCTYGLNHLDPTGCPKLQRLSADVTSLSSIDVSKNPNLRILNVSDTYITSLDVSNNRELQQLFVGHMASFADGYKISSLDLSHNPKLQYLFAQNNALKTLDISNNPLLSDLFVQKNVLESLDLSANPALFKVDISDNYLNYGNLPLGREFAGQYYYSQRPMPVATSFPVGGEIDLSAKVIREGTLTEMKLYGVPKSDMGNPVILSEDYYEYKDGVLKFKREYADSVYVNFTNADFPDCVLNTTKFMVKTAEEYGKPSRSISFSPVIGAGSEISFGLGVSGASSDSPRTVFVDFGDGVTVPVSVSCQIPEGTNVTGQRAGSGSMAVYVNDGDNITALSIDGYNLYNIDVTSAPTLRTLTLKGTDLSYIDLSWQRCLETLTLNGNRFGTLDLISDIPGYSKNVLSRIDLSDNQIYDLDYQAGGGIKELNLSHNHLSTLPIEKAYNLVKLDVSHNEFTSLQISNLDSLQSLNVASNRLTEIEIPWQETLADLDCSDNDLTFETIPFKPGALKGNYVYAPQRNIAISSRGPGFNVKKVGLSVDGVSTVFVLHKEDGSLLTEGVDYDFKDGTVTFKDYSLGKVYCSMTNDVYPGLTISTTMMLVSEPPTNLLGWMDVASRTSEASAFMSIAAAESGESLYIDWDGEGKNYSEYVLGTEYTVFTAEPVAGRRACIYSYEKPEFLTVFSINNIPLVKADFSAMKGLNLFAVRYAGCTDLVLPDTDNLESLSIEGNGFTSVDPTRLQKLTYLGADDNNIKTFDLSKFPMLKVVALRNNGLTDINLENDNVWFLSLSGNELEEISFAGLPSLDVADLGYNKISKIDIDGPRALGELYVVGNRLDFQTLPLVPESVRRYHYNDQAHIPAICDGMTVDLSSQAMSHGVPTSFYWCLDEPYYDDETGGLYVETLNPGVDYTINEGVTTFYKEQANVCCLMMNELFPTSFLLTDMLTITGAGVEAAVAKAASISVDGRSLTISAEEDTPYAVYSTDGKTIASGVIADRTVSIDLPAAGVYVVKAGKASMKIAVK